MNRRTFLIFLSICLTLTTVGWFIYLALVLHDYIAFWVGLVITLIYSGIISVRLLNFNRILKWEEIPEEVQKKYDGFTTRLLQRENINLFILLSFFFNLCASPIMISSSIFFAWLILTLLITIYLLRELEHTTYIEEQLPQSKKNKIVAVLVYSLLIIFILIRSLTNGFSVHELSSLPLDSVFRKLFTIFLLGSLWLFLVRFTWKEWSSQRFFRYLQYFILFFSLTFFVGRFAIYNIQHHAVYYANQMKHDKYNDPVLIAMMDFARTTDFPDTVTYKQTDNKDVVEIKSKNFSGYALYHNDGAYHSVYDSQYTFQSDELFMQISDKGCFEIYTMALLNKPGYKILNEEECLRSIQDWVKKTEQETLKEQNNPFINLQYIYNMLYQNKFK
ncbi:hypothetical protein [Lactococcus sp. DD01]|uniref:hypothetical protein n=1 Tax=Lactococcus sp. DD01 TaxID=1776443 RepID=UPI0007944250|nr:hypothetical protein [Lactococcus sp. DD01]KXT59130.1 hypothetical protein LACDD01_02210 [Lactococcus sp. DD01]